MQNTNPMLSDFQQARSSVPNTALYISKDKSLPCVNVMTVNKKAHYGLVVNFKEAQEFLQMFPSSVSLKDNGNILYCSVQAFKFLGI